MTQLLEKINPQIGNNANMTFEASYYDIFKISQSNISQVFY